MVTNIPTRLRVLGAKVENSFECINSGGCCVFAAMVGEHLARYVPTRIAVAGARTDVTIDDARKNVKNNTVPEWSDNGIWFWHVGVEFLYNDEWWLFDTDACKITYKRLLADVMPVPGRLTVQEAKELASSADGWNSRFDRQLIPKLQRMVDEFFAQEQFH